ncbi:hypothetical protein [Nocardia sp. NRRL S-836]|uniref:hypothetical protein n=1 Tax=Nocardia sp. NRRL S-836 TaxID=1519492 RepID=UPI0006AE3F7B|nr:hypothetical protein [Nocardia sp. NRRL S-836]KOV81840.1 hypothetical protein ADL03_27160 [Nocardia sp. NRRL S-836]
MLVQLCDPGDVGVSVRAAGDRDRAVDVPDHGAGRAEGELREHHRRADAAMAGVELSLVKAHERAGRPVVPAVVHEQQRDLLLGLQAHLAVAAAVR